MIYLFRNSERRYHVFYFYFLWMHCDFHRNDDWCFCSTASVLSHVARSNSTQTWWACSPALGEKRKKKNVRVVSKEWKPFVLGEESESDGWCWKWRSKWQHLRRSSDVRMGWGGGGGRWVKLSNKERGALINLIAQWFVKRWHVCGPAAFSNNPRLHVRIHRDAQPTATYIFPSGHTHVYSARACIQGSELDNDSPDLAPYTVPVVTLSWLRGFAGWGWTSQRTQHKRYYITLAAEVGQGLEEGAERWERTNGMQRGEVKDDS